MDRTIAQHERILRAMPLLKDMPPAEMERFLLAARTHTWRRGETICHQGDAADLLLCVVRGTARMVRLTDDGEEKTCGFVEAGQPIGLVALLDGRPHAASAVAHEETTCVWVGRPEFQALFLGSAERLRAVTAALCADVRAAMEDVTDLVPLDASRRLVRVLTRLCERHGQPLDGDRMQLRLPLSNPDLALLIGTRRDTATRLVHQLVEAGYLVVADRQMTVAHWSTFRHLNEV